jgi:hypothetical protein
MNPLLIAMLNAAMAQQPRQPARTASGALVRAMMSKRQAAKDASLAALKPYAESQHADRYGAAPTQDLGAFQSDSFANDAFQVSGET